MARTLLNGSEEIQSGTIPWAAMASGAIVPTTSLVDGAMFVKNNGTVAMAAALVDIAGGHADHPANRQRNCSADQRHRHAKPEQADVQHFTVPGPISHQLSTLPLIYKKACFLPQNPIHIEPVSVLQHLSLFKISQ